MQWENSLVSLTKPCPVYVWSLESACLNMRWMVCITPLSVSRHTTSMKNVLLQLTQWGPLLSLLRIFLQNSGQDCHMCVWYILTVHIITRELEPCLGSSGLWDALAKICTEWRAEAGAAARWWMGPFYKSPVETGESILVMRNVFTVDEYLQRAHKLGARFKKIHHPVQTWQRRVFDDTWDKKHSSTGFNKPRLLPLSVLIRCVDCTVHSASRQAATLSDILGHLMTSHLATCKKSKSNNGFWIAVNT